MTREFLTPVLLPAGDPPGDNYAASKGYVDANGGGGGGAMVPIQQVVVPAGGQATITFPDIPQDYEDLVLVVRARSEQVVTADSCDINFNNDTSGNYNWQRWVHADGTGTNTGSEGASDTAGYVLSCPGANAPADEFGSASILIAGYTRTDINKSWRTDSGYLANTGFVAAEEFFGSWDSTAAITEIDLVTDGGDDFAEGTVATLYGVDATATGGGSTVPEWMEHLAADGTEDEGQEFTGAIGGTEVKPSGNATWTQSRGLLSAAFDTQTASDLVGRMYALSGTWQDNAYLEGAVRLASMDEPTSFAGLLLADGTTATDNIVVARWSHIGGRDRQLAINTGTYTNYVSGAGSGQIVVFSGDRVYLRVTGLASNNWRVEASVDGVSWSVFNTSDVNFTFTPTHYGFAVSRPNAGAEVAVASCEYLRLYGLA